MAIHTFVCQTHVRYDGKLYKPGELMNLSDSKPQDVILMDSNPDYLKGKTGPKPKAKKVGKAKD